MEDARDFTLEQGCFTLAMLSYLGTQNASPDAINDVLLRVALDEALEKFAPVRGRWEMAWGPVTYTAPFTLFADSGAFIVRDRWKPSRLCVVVRGTNPYSAFDWVYGDIWVDRVVPWRFGNRTRVPGAALSLSSALGLSILENMRWFEFPDLGLEAFRDFIRQRLLAPAEWTAKQLLGPLQAELSGWIDRGRGALAREQTALLSERDALAHDLEQRLAAFARIRNAPSTLRLRKHLDHSLRRALGGAEIDLLHLMEGVQRFHSFLHPGQSIQGFLEQEVRRSRETGDGSLDVYVTGHSKGGALAPVVAQWLSDTRRTWRSGWNRELDARIHCYAFAGPTPGNRAFAQLSDRTLEDRGHRISNRHDVVPHSWAVPSRHFEPHLDLLQVPDLYRSTDHVSPRAHKLLSGLIDGIADDVGPLAYAHVGGDVRLFEGKLDEDSRDFFTHLLNQHTKAYIRELGLERYLNLSDLFTLL
ncbi:MAG: hypothetical protein AAF430_26335 [Myxococcota bacterium]